MSPVDCSGVHTCSAFCTSCRLLILPGPIHELQVKTVWFKIKNRNENVYYPSLNVETRVDSLILNLVFWTNLFYNVRSVWAWLYFSDLFCTSLRFLKCLLTCFSLSYWYMKCFQVPWKKGTLSSQNISVHIQNNRSSL